MCAALACAISNWIQDVTGIDDGRGRARRTVARMRRELSISRPGSPAPTGPQNLQPPPDQGRLTIVLIKLQTLPTTRAG